MIENHTAIAIAGLCDAIKRLEKAIRTGDMSYVDECEEKRERVERKILNQINPPK